MSWVPWSCWSFHCLVPRTQPACGSTATGSYPGKSEKRKSQRQKPLEHAYTERMFDTRDGKQRFLEHGFYGSYESYNVDCMECMDLKKPLRFASCKAGISGYEADAASPGHVPRPQAPGTYRFCRCFVTKPTGKVAQQRIHGTSTSSAAPFVFFRCAWEQCLHRAS